MRVFDIPVQTHPVEIGNVCTLIHGNLPKPSWPTRCISNSCYCVFAVVIICRTFACSPVIIVPLKKGIGGRHTKHLSPTFSSAAEMTPTTTTPPFSKSESSEYVAKKRHSDSLAAHSSRALKEPQPAPSPELGEATPIKSSQPSSLSEEGAEDVALLYTEKRSAPGSFYRSTELQQRRPASSPELVYAGLIESQPIPFSSFGLRKLLQIMHRRARKTQVLLPGSSHSRRRRGMQCGVLRNSPRLVSFEAKA